MPQARSLATQPHLETHRSPRRESDESAIALGVAQWPRGGTDRKKRRRPTHPKVANRPTLWLPGDRGFTPTVPLPAASAWPDSAAVRPTGAPASIPKRLGRAARFTSAGAASRPGRGPAPHTARRGATSTWTRHATGLAGPREVIHPDRQTPEALVCVGAFPGILLLARHTRRG